MTLFAVVYGCACGGRATAKLTEYELEERHWKGGVSTVKCPFCGKDMWEEKRIPDNENIIITQIERWIEKTPDMVM